MYVFHRPEQRDEVMARRSSEKLGRKKTYDSGAQQTQAVVLKINNYIKATLATSDLQSINTVTRDLG